MQIRDGFYIAEYNNDLMLNIQKNVDINSLEKILKIIVIMFTFLVLFGQFKYLKF